MNNTLNKFVKMFSKSNIFFWLYSSFFFVTCKNHCQAKKPCSALAGLTFLSLLQKNICKAQLLSNKNLQIKHCLWAQDGNRWIMCFDSPLLFVIIMLHGKVKTWGVYAIVDKVGRFHLIQEVVTG